MLAVDGLLCDAKQVPISAQLSPVWRALLTATSSRRVNARLCSEILASC
jgi:hypothetical protein